MHAENIDFSLVLLRNSIDSQLIANLRETKEQLDADINMITDEVDKEQS